MFFRRKTHPVQDFISRVLADYFSLEPAEVASWVSVDGAAVSIVLPFACKTQHDQINAYLLQQLAQSSLSVDEVTVSGRIHTGQTKQPSVVKVLHCEVAFSASYISTRTHMRSLSREPESS